MLSDQTERRNHFDSHLTHQPSQSNNLCHTSSFLFLALYKSTVHLYSLIIDYLMADFKHSQIRQLGAEIESISFLCLNAHCREKILCADLRFGLLRLSTMKKCPHMLRSDHRELRNSYVEFMWVVGGGWWWVV